MVTNFANGTLDRIVFMWRRGPRNASRRARRAGPSLGHEGARTPPGCGTTSSFNNGQPGGARARLLFTQPQGVTASKALAFASTSRSEAARGSWKDCHIGSLTDPAQPGLPRPDLEQRSSCADGSTRPLALFIRHRTASRIRTLRRCVPQRIRLATAYAPPKAPGITFRRAAGKMVNARRKQHERDWCSRTFK
jgi:hypothetical protein